MVDVSKALQTALQQLHTERALLDRRIAALEQVLSRRRAVVGAKSLLYHRFGWPF